MLQDGVAVEQFGSPEDAALEGLVAMADGTPVLIASTGRYFDGSDSDDPVAVVISARGEVRRGQKAWTRLFSTPMVDLAGGLAYADGHLYATAYSNGSLGGPALGHYDAFAAKLDEDGGVIWQVQWGSNHLDAPSGIAINEAGEVFVHGSTYGNLGAPAAQSSSLFVSRLSASGEVGWSTQWGGEFDDISGKIAATPDGAYAGGCLAGALGYVARITASGEVDWVYEVGSEGCVLDVIALPAGDVLAVGRGSTPNLTVEGSGPTFVVRLTADGELVWARRSAGSAHRMALAGDTLYLGGRSVESDGFAGHKGRGDAFVSAHKLSTGELLWRKQFGTAEEDNLMGLAVAPDGTVYAGGETSGHFPGYTHRNSVLDLWLARIRP